MIRTTTVVACLGLSACSTVTDFRTSVGGLVAPSRVTSTPAPQPQILTAKERLLVAIEGQGCELNATNVNAVLADAVINREELLQLTPQLQSEGRVEVAGSGAIRSTSAICI
ncbi:MAG: hypothetical protein KC448_12155 [Yoonia sp.]|nr:hypothetical protein [Yoonia sp.]